MIAGQEYHGGGSFAPTCPCPPCAVQLRSTAMAFDREKRVRALAELRRRQVMDEASLTPTERLMHAEELLALAWSIHGPPPEQPWSLLAARQARRRK